MTENTTLRNIVRALLFTIVTAEIIGLSGVAKSPLSTVKTSYEDGEVFLSFALLGTTLIHFWGRPRRSEVVTTLVFGAILNALLAPLRPAWFHTVEMTLMTCGYGFGTVSFLFLFRKAWRERGMERQPGLTTLLAASVIPMYVVLVEFFLRLTYLHIVTYDRLLYAWDDALGFQPSFHMGRMFLRWEWLKASSLTIYLALPLAFSLLVALQINRRTAPVNVLLGFLSVGATGYVLYHLYPAIGPRYMLGPVFPLGEPPPATDLSPLMVYEPLRRNAMPSLHTAWVLILWWNARAYGRWVQAVALTFLVLTLLGTLGLGEHYVIDLVVAVPFTVAVQAAVTTSPAISHPKRTAAFVGGIVMTALWFYLLRFHIGLFLKSPVVPWTSSLLTIIVSAWLERSLARVWMEQNTSKDIEFISEELVPEGRSAS